MPASKSELRLLDHCFVCKTTKDRMCLKKCANCKYRNDYALRKCFQVYDRLCLLVNVPLLYIFCFFFPSNQFLVISFYGEVLLPLNLFKQLPFHIFSLPQWLFSAMEVEVAAIQCPSDLRLSMQFGFRTVQHGLSTARPGCRRSLGSETAFTVPATMQYMMLHFSSTWETEARNRICEKVRPWNVFYT